MSESLTNAVDRALFEREAELSALRGLLHAARAGDGRLAVLRGPPGIGKSALLQAAQVLAEDKGFAVLAARGVELEREFPFGVARQLFEPALRPLTLADRHELMSGAAALSDRALGVSDPGAGSGDASALFAALHGLYWLAANLAERAPVLVSVDDTQWADLTSLRWLCYLAHRLDGVALLVLIACREGVSGPVEPLIDELTREQASRVIAPAPLSDDGVRRLIEDAFESPPEEAFVRACHAQSTGNPLLVRELAKALIADGALPDAHSAQQVLALPPQAALRAVHVRLGRLPAPVAALARGIAVLESSVGLREAAALAELDDPAAARAADALAAAGILEPGVPLRFVHPLIHAAVYDEIPRASRRHDHACAASLLRDDPAARERVTAHLLACDPIGKTWAIEHLRGDAARALSSGAPETAILYLQRALAEGPIGVVRCAVLRDLGVAEARVSPSRAIDHLRMALGASVTADERIAILGELAVAMLASERVREAYETLTSALEEVPRADRELALRIEAELLAVGMQGSSLADSVSQRVALIPPLSGETTGECLLLANVARHRQLIGAPTETGLLAAHAAAEALLLSEQAPNSPTFFGALSTLWHSEHHGAAERMLEQVVADARARGSVLGLATAGCLQGPLSFHRGELGSADTHAQSTLEFSRKTGFRAAIAIGAATCVLVAIERGQLDHADAVLSENGFIDGVSETLVMFNFVLHARGCLRIAQGRRGEGIADLLELGRRERACGHNCALYLWRAPVASALGAADRRDDGLRLAEEELRLARRRGTAGPQGVALRALALVEGGSAGIEHLREAVRILEPTPFRLEHARALADLGAGLRRAGRRSEARDYLRRALDLAHRCGATTLRERAHQELLATGARPRKLALSGADALTASERRVAELAADGLTNKEIAQALFVTMRTVTTHLTHIYTKLAISSRNELPAKLAHADATIAPSSATAST